MNKYILLSFLLVGCATKPTITAPIETDKRIRIDSSLLQPCPQLVESVTEDDLPFVILKNIELYAICKNRQDTSIKIIKELTNNE